MDFSEIKIQDDEALRIGLLGEEQASTLDIELLFTLAGGMLNGVNEKELTLHDADENEHGTIEVTRTRITLNSADENEIKKYDVIDTIQVCSNDDEEKTLLRLSYINGVLDKEDPDRQTYFGDARELNQALEIIQKELEISTDTLKMPLYSIVLRLCKIALGFEDMPNESSFSPHTKGGVAELIGNVATRRAIEQELIAQMSYPLSDEVDIAIVGCEYSPNPELEEFFNGKDPVGNIKHLSDDDMLGLKLPKIQVCLQDKAARTVTVALLKQNDRVFSSVLPDTIGSVAVIEPVFAFSSSAEGEEHKIDESGHYAEIISTITSALLDLSFTLEIL